VWSCVLDPTATLAATGSADFSAKIWDALTGLEKATLPHKHIVRACCFAPCSTKLATGGAKRARECARYARAAARGGGYW
jgi:serine-threonine kinase receptor-associated protein